MRQLRVAMFGLALLTIPLAGTLPRADGEVTTARAATVWDVQAGGDVPEEGVQTHAYYPRMLTIHEGDTVRWTFAGRASVTFDRFRPALEHMIPGPNPGDLTLGPSWFPQGPSGPDAEYDGTEIANSGVANGPLDETPPYQLTFPRAGIYTYVDIIHPGTSGVIQVLPASARLVETPAEAAARGRSEYATVLAALRGQIAETRPIRVAGPNGTTIFAVTMGTSTGLGGGANRYLPAELTVRRGDTVIWNNSDDYAPHTITFPSGGPMPPFLVPVPQPSGPPLIVAPAQSIGPVGGNVYRGEGLLNSGLVMYGNAFAVTFDAPPGTYEFACVLHSDFGQRGRVTVIE